MGDIIKVYDFDLADSGNLMKPIVFCNPPKEIEDIAISINIPLAKELMKQGSTTMRTMRMEQNLLQILSTMENNPVLMDFDVMFNPAYKMDVIKLLISVCRKKQFCVIWPGRYEDGKLYYAEENYKDYKAYDIANYDITVIV